MKKLKTTLLLLFIACTQLTTAQIEVNESHKFDLFTSYGNSNTLTYTLSRLPKIYDKQYLTTFDLGGKKLETIEIQSKQGGELMNAINIGNNTLFYFNFNYSKDILFILIDENGKEIKRKTLTYLKIFGTTVLPIGNDKFCLVSGVKNKKQGIQAECFDLNLNSLWTYTNIPEKSKYFYKNAIANSKGEIAVLYTIKSVDYHIAFIDATGKLTGDQKIDETDLDHFTPYKMYFSSNEELLLFSDYGTANEIAFMTTPLGLNIKHFNHSATETASQNIDFKTIQMQAGDKDQMGNLIHPIAPSLRVVDIKEINGATKLITESYFFNKREVSKPSSTAGAPATVEVYKAMTLMDLYILDLKDPGTNIHRIWKSNRTLSIKGVKFYDATDFCDALEINNMFGYQGLLGQHILIRGFGQNHEYFNQIPLNANWENVNERVYFGLPISDKPTSANFLQEFSGGLGRLHLNAPKFLNTSGRLLLYRYHSPTASIQFSILK